MFLDASFLLVSPNLIRMTTMIQIRNQSLLLFSSPFVLRSITWFNWIISLLRRNNDENNWPDDLISNRTKKVYNDFSLSFLFLGIQCTPRKKDILVNNWKGHLSKCSQIKMLYGWKKCLGLGCFQTSNLIDFLHQLNNLNYLLRKKVKSGWN